MIESDVLVIGTGIAGCITALELAKRGLTVSMISKAQRAEETSTEKAQGGIIYRGAEDSTELLKRDIMEAGDGTCYEPAVDILVKEGPELVKRLLVDEYGVEFDRNGGFNLTLEAGHSLPRIVHVNDTTGKAVEKALVNAIKSQDNIRIDNEHVLVDLLKDEQGIGGAWVFDERHDTVKELQAKATVLATGGLGQIFAHTTNPASATGDGFAAAHRAGAELMNMEYVQFHPTTLLNGFLVSESMRGEGGRLKNQSGEEFMQRYSEHDSLATRDVVARAMHQEMVRRGEEYLLLDIASYRDGGWIRNRFPGIYEECLKQGIDITSEPIPVAPAAHFACGGVRVDLCGRTSLKGLYAVGEVSCTGLHGANRLASTSLLEGLVWGYRAAGDIRKHLDDLHPSAGEWRHEGTDKPDPILISEHWGSIRKTMWERVGLIRCEKDLIIADKELSSLRGDIEDLYKSTQMNRTLIELRNGVECALLVARAALRDRESRGCHYRIN
jgi:L-aspartate oxidase